MYRTKERLGILCGSEAPNEGAYAIAQAEADAWLAEQRPLTQMQWWDK